MFGRASHGFHLRGILGCHLAITGLPNQLLDSPHIARHAVAAHTTSVRAPMEEVTRGYVADREG